MREKFFTISEIERLMAGSLDGAQMERLHAVLTHCLLGQEDFPAADSGSLNNTEMLDAFFGAKAVEGCSPRSIKYYTITLKRLHHDKRCTILFIRVSSIGYREQCDRRQRAAHHFELVFLA